MVLHDGWIPLGNTIGLFCFLICHPLLSISLYLHFFIFLFLLLVSLSIFSLIYIYLYPSLSESINTPRVFFFDRNLTSSLNLICLIYVCVV